MFGGGLITAALTSGGARYAHENKAISANGVYMPNNNVRWDKVTVDVPQSDMLTAISQFPVYGGGSVGSDYHFLVHMGRLLRADQYQFGIIEQDDGTTKEFTRYKDLRYDVWLLLYNNTDNKPLVAFDITNTVSNGVHDVIQYNNEGKLISEYHVIAITDVMAEIAKYLVNGNYRCRISITGISAKQRRITYDPYTGEIKTDVITTYSIPPNKNFYIYFGEFNNGYTNITSTSYVIVLNGMGEEETKQLVDFLNTTDTIPIL